MGKKWSKVKRNGLLLILAIILILNNNYAYAQLVDALPIYGEIDGGKDSPFKGADITWTEPSYADPFNHRDFEQEPTVGGQVYYLPPGVLAREQRIHSNYSANTDACAACHFTHTALGPSLLQWPSVYEACISCHDGTLGDYTYDVLSGLIRQEVEDGGGKSRTFGGLFGDNMKIADINNTVYNPDSLSNHMPDGTVRISAPAAPGGEPDLDDNEVLGCVSCHTPHGQGGNARILNPDPNKLRFKQYRDYLKAGTPVINDEYVRYLKPVPSADSNVFKDNEDIINWIPGYPYASLTKIIIADNLYDMTTKPRVQLENGVLTLITTDYFLEPEDYQINYREGTVTLSQEAMDLKQWRDVYAIYVPGIYIAMEIENYLQSNEIVTYLAKDKNNRPTSINEFCEACHYDYNTEHVNDDNPTVNPRTGVVEPYGSAKVNTGKNSQAYRHQVGNQWVDEEWGREATPPVIKFSQDGENKIITCLTCHVAHGVDKEYWKDTNEGYLDFPEDDDGYVYDQNPSSALKRLPNMAVCEACHQMKYAAEGRTGPN